MRKFDYDLFVIGGALPLGAQRQEGEVPVAALAMRRAEGVTN